MVQDDNSLVSFVIPCYRSEKTILPVIDEIQQLMDGQKRLSYEIVAVVDGSPDHVFDVLCEAAKSRPFLKVLELTKNYGQSSAKAAGYDIAAGQFIVTLDDDGQCPVENVFAMVRKIEEGSDFVVARYPKKVQSAFKNFGSRVNRYMAVTCAGLPKGFVMSNFYVFNRMVADALKQQENPFPYLSACIARITNRIDYVEMEERTRLSGTSTYTFRKMLGMWTNGLIGFTDKPLRISFVLCTVSLVLFVLFAIVSIVQLALGSEAVGVFFLAMICSFFFTLLFAQQGLMGEYVSRIMQFENGKPVYTVRNSINTGDEM